MNRSIVAAEVTVQTATGDVTVKGRNRVDY
jgi:hypothetical protein